MGNLFSSLIEQIGDSLKSAKESYSSPKQPPLKVAIFSWNCGSEAGARFREDILASKINNDNPDIIVLGFQEVYPISLRPTSTLRKKIKAIVKNNYVNLDPEDDISTCKASGVLPSKSFIIMMQIYVKKGLKDCITLTKKDWCTTSLPSLAGGGNIFSNLGQAAKKHGRGALEAARYKGTAILGSARTQGTKTLEAARYKGTKTLEAVKQLSKNMITRKNQMSKYGMKGFVQYTLTYKKKKYNFICTHAPFKNEEKSIEFMLNLLILTQVDKNDRTFLFGNLNSRSYLNDSCY